MKRLIFIGILCFLFANASFAQSKIGVTAGINASDYFININGNKYQSEAKIGYQVGLVADVEVTESFSIIPELLFNQQGGEFTYFNYGGVTGFNIGFSDMINYLSLPVNLAYKINTSKSSKLFVFAGPYLSYGLSGNAKIRIGNVSESEKITFGSGEDGIKRFDFGMNTGLGYQIKNFFLKLQYSTGLSNISNNDNESFKNRAFSFKIGCYFN